MIPKRPSHETAVSILYVDTCIGLAGGQYSLIEILKFLDTSRFSPVVASPPISGLRWECEHLGVKWVPIPFESAHLNSSVGTSLSAQFADLANSARGVSDLSGVIRREGVRIVHSNTFKAALVGGLAALVRDRPHVFHDRSQIAHQPLGWLVAMLSRRIIAISQSAGLKHRWPFGRKVRVIPSGIDTDRVVPAEAGSDRKRVCYVGRISDEKNLGSLVECAPLVVARIPDCTFIIAGTAFTVRDRDYFENVKRRIADLGLSESFEIVGYVEDVPALLGKCSVLVLPSKREALGRVMLEAMAVRTPVVAFRTGGPGEVITDRETGLLADPGDVTGLANAIVEVLSDPDLSRRLGRQGRELVVKGFSSRVVTEQIMRVYDEILCRGA